MTIPIGQTIANRRLEASLGSGELGEVFRVTNLDTGGTEALRLFPPGLSISPGFADSFAAEAAGLATLRHPHVVTFFMGGQEGGRCFLAMEYVPDGSLRSLLQRRSSGALELAIDQGIDLMRQAAEGLAYIHSQNRLHRNLKPESLLLTRAASAPGGYTVKLGDFGISHLINLNTTPVDPIPLTTRTAIYAPPEQFNGMAYDLRSDLYVLGIVLYEVIAGTLPFTIRSFDEGYRKHLHEQPRPPREVREEISADLEAILVRCLAKDPADRYQSAIELANALGQLQRKREQEPVGPPTISPLTGPSSLPRIQVARGQKKESDVVPLTGEGLTIGRDPKSDIVLEHDQVDQRHAVIDWDGTQAEVTDLGSTSGTLMGTERLPPNVPRPWSLGNLLRIGPYWMQLNMPRANQEANVPVPPPLPEPFGTTPPPTQPAHSSRDNPLTGIFQTIGGFVSPPPPPPPPPTSSIELVRHIVVSVEEKVLSLTPGQPAQCILVLSNQGKQVDHLTIDIDGVPRQWWRGPEELVQLNPSERQSVVLQINVPQEPQSLVKTYTVRIRALSDNKREFGETAAQWTVLPFYRSDVWVPRRRRGGWFKAAYTIGVRNQGNIPSTFTISGTDQEEDGSIFYDVEPPQITPAPGLVTRSVITARARPHLYGRSLRREFTIAITPSKGEEQKTQLAYFTQRPLVPWWLGPALLVLLLLAAGLIYWFSIPTLVLRPEPDGAVVLRQTVTARWNVDLEATVVLRVNQTPVRITQVTEGTYSFQVRNASPIVFSLEARTLYGAIVRTQVALPLEVYTPEPPPPTFTPTSTSEPSTTTIPTEPPSPTETPIPSETPSPTITLTPSSTSTSTPTTTPTSILPCWSGPDHVIVGRDPQRASVQVSRRVPVLVYFVRTHTDGSTTEEVVGGGTTEVDGTFRIPINIRNQRPADYQVIVRERYTGRLLSVYTCGIPATPKRTALPTVVLTPQEESEDNGDA